MANESKDMRCPSCDGQEIRVIGKIQPSNTFGGRTLQKALPGGILYACEACRLFFRWPRRTRDEAAGLYRELGLHNWRFAYDDRDDWKIAESYLKKSLGGGNVLDIGCFDGDFLSRFSDGWGRFGVEINEAAADRAKNRGIQVVADDFHHLEVLRLQFDAVVAFDVIEHVEDPRIFLNEITRVAKPGGHIIISTGDTDAPSWRFMGSGYWYCTYSEHISFINRRWCEGAARILGLDIVHYERFSHAGRRRTLLKMALELTKNLVYRVSPGFFGWLRSIGIGDADIESYPEIRNNPPPWNSAKDHIVVIFRKG